MPIVSPIIPYDAILKVVPMNKKEITFEKIHYKHFLRLNNKKSKHKVVDIEKAGYTVINVDASKLSDYWKVFECSNWCKENLKEGSYVKHKDSFCFAYKHDAIHFSMEAMIFSD